MNAQNCSLLATLDNLEPPFTFSEDGMLLAKAERGAIEVVDYPASQTIDRFLWEAVDEIIHLSIDPTNSCLLSSAIIDGNQELALFRLNIDAP